MWLHELKLNFVTYKIELENIFTIQMRTIETILSTNKLYSNGGDARVYVYFESTESNVAATAISCTIFIAQLIENTNVTFIAKLISRSTYSIVKEIKFISIGKCTIDFRVSSGNSSRGFTGTLRDVGSNVFEQMPLHCDRTENCNAFSLMHCNIYIDRHNKLINGTSTLFALLLDRSDYWQVLYRNRFESIARLCSHTIATRISTPASCWRCSRLFAVHLHRDSKIKMT